MHLDEIARLLTSDLHTSQQDSGSTLKSFNSSNIDFGLHGSVKVSKITIALDFKTTRDVLRKVSAKHVAYFVKVETQ